MLPSFTMDPKKQKPITRRVCPDCKGSGLDKKLHRRYTTGGHDKRRCKRCNGECYIEDEEESTDAKSK